MALPLTQPFGTFSVGQSTNVSGGTAFVSLIPPYEPPGGVKGTPIGAVKPGPGIIHVTSFWYTVPTTAHTLYFMRPLNWTTFKADAAASQAVVVISADPGTWATAGVYQYPLANTSIPSTGNNTIGANDYVVYQAASGQWIVDTVASGTSPTLTLTTNLPTGGVKKGGLFYFFGLKTDTDPATNAAHNKWLIDAATSGTTTRAFQDPIGLFCTLHPGDPLVILSDNASAQGYLEMVNGYYAGK